MERNLMKCPLCKSDQNRVFHKWNNFIVLKCNNCSFSFIDLDSWEYPYKDMDYYRGAPELLELGEKAWISRRVKIIKKYVSAGRSIDIGCGQGEIPIALQRRGFNAEGLDESTYIINLLKKNSPKVKWYAGLAEDLLSSLGRYDVVTLYHVLEHIPHPLDAMRNILKLVKKGGVIIIEVPNIGGNMAKLKGRGWHYYLNHHVNYFRKIDLVRMTDLLDCQMVAVLGDYDFTFPTGKRWKVMVKSFLKNIGFNDVLTIVIRVS